MIVGVKSCNNAFDDCADYVDLTRIPAYESSNDAYRVFRTMLESGHRPDDYNQLLAEALPKTSSIRHHGSGSTSAALY